MNILYRACASKNGYQSEILKRLKSKNIFEKCTVITQSLDNMDDYSSVFFHEIPAGIGYNVQYNTICDMEEIEEPDEELLKALSVYESTALNMTCRNYHMHIMHFDEMEKEYLTHVKFWNWLMDTDKIDFVFFTTVPHHVWEYVMYAVAKAKNIPTLIETVATIPGLNEVGTSIESIGSNVYKIYDSAKDIIISPQVEKFYNNILNQHKYISVKERNGLMKQHKQWVFNTYYKPIIDRITKENNLIIDIKEKRTKEKFNKDMQSVIKDIKLFGRVCVGQLNQYNTKYYSKNIAEAVDYNKKYIYYALQYFPESSVLPRGGVFWNQLSAIKMLAKSAKKNGIAVYVKEHWLEESRTKEFYKELRSISNVYLLSTGEDTYRILDHAMAVSSETGTCMHESIIRGIPVITFGNHCLCGAPGVFRVGSEAEISSAIETILSNKNELNRKEVRKYYAAMSMGLVKGYLDWPRKPDYKLEECIDDTVNLIESFVQSGFDNDFCFIRDDL